MTLISLLFFASRRRDMSFDCGWSPAVCLSVFRVKGGLPRGRLGSPGHGARGEARLEHVEGVVPVAQRPAHFAHEVLHMGVALDGEQIGHPHRAELCHAPHVIPPQIHQHHVLGALLLVGEEGARQRLVVLPRRPAGRVPAMGRTVTSPPSTRTSTSGELPTNAKSSNWRWNRYG